MWGGSDVIAYISMSNILKTEEAQTKHKETRLFGVILKYGGDGAWVTSEWPIHIILISKKPKQHKRKCLQHKDWDYVDH